MISNMRIAITWPRGTRGCRGTLEAGGSGGGETAGREVVHGTKEVGAMAVKNDKQYEALKDKGMSKERAAKIANSPGASRHGGEKSHSGSGKSSHGGTTAQHKAAGRKGGKATAAKR